MIAARFGPAISLFYSLLGIAFGTFMLGILPTHSQIGYLAPILLIILRSISGICSAGEITIAKLYILSNRTEEEVNRNSYLYQTSSMLGIIMASFVSSIILAMGDGISWRICFIIGGVAGFFGYVLRNYEDEKQSITKQDLLKFHSFLGINTLWQHKIVLFRVAIVSAFSYVTYSIPFIVMNSLTPKFSDATISNMMASNTMLLTLDMMILPVIGHFLIKYDTQKTLLSCVFLCLISSIPMWYFANNASFIYLISLKLWIIIIGVGFACKVNIWHNKQIQGEEKYLIIGIGSAIGSASIGKMAPTICLILYQYFQNPVVIGLFITMIATMTLAVIYYEKKSSVAEDLTKTQHFAT